MTSQYLSVNAIQSRRRISSKHFLFSHNPLQWNIFNSRERSFLFKERMTPDCLLHDLLITKLAAYGFEYDSLVFIQSYLSERQQRTKVNMPTTLILTYYMLFHKVLYQGHYFSVFILAICFTILIYAILPAMLRTIHYTPVTLTQKK